MTSVPCPGCGSVPHNPDCAFCLRAKRIADWLSPVVLWTTTSDTGVNAALSGSYDASPLVQREQPK